MPRPIRAENEIKMSGSEAEHEYWGKLARTFHGDALLLVNLLHIVESPIAVLKESHRVLSSDGRIVIVDVTGHGMSLLKKMKLVISYLKKIGEPPSNNKSFSQGELAAMINEAGFAVEETELIGNDTKAVCLTGKKNVSYTQNVE